MWRSLSLSLFANFFYLVFINAYCNKNAKKSMCECVQFVNMFFFLKLHLCLLILYIQFVCLFNRLILKENEVHQMNCIFIYIYICRERERDRARAIRFYKHLEFVMILKLFSFSLSLLLLLSLLIRLFTYI
jgi:hypothetical protein